MQAASKNYFNRYINDFNITAPIESNYEYDNTKVSVDSLPYHKQQADSFDVLYPDPEDVRTRMNEHHEDSVVKICEQRKLMTQLSSAVKTHFHTLLFPLLLLLCKYDKNENGSADTTRIRQPKKENKIIRINQTHGIDDLNNADLNVSFELFFFRES